MSVQEENSKIFSKEIDTYKAKYFRRDEEYLVSKYFKGSVLVLGCGAGRTLEPLYEKGFSVTAIDINPDMVGYAKKTNPQIPIMQMDASNLQFEDNSFDTVFFPFHGIDYIHPDIYKAVAEVNRVLKSNRTFIFSSHNRFFIKSIHRFFDGNYSNYQGLITYRTTYLDWFRLKKYFRKVKIIQRISIAVSWKDANWKDILYKLLPFFNKSTYFICQEPVKK